VEGAGDFLVLQQAHLVLHRRRRRHLRGPGASDGEGSTGSEARVWDGGMGTARQSGLVWEESTKMPIGEAMAEFRSRVR
jgi:hypothetical protein